MTIIERRSYAFDVKEADNKRTGKSSRRTDAVRKEWDRLLFSK